MFINVTPGTPNFTAEQMFTLIVSLFDHNKSHKKKAEKVNLSIWPDRGEDCIEIEFREQTATKPAYASVQLPDDPGFVLELHCFSVKSQEIANGDYVDKQVVWYAQFSAWDIDTAEQVEIWYFTMMARLLQLAGNSTVAIDHG